MRGGLAARAGAGRGAGRGAGWLLLIDATGAPVGEGGDLALAMPIDKVAEARISAEEEAREAAREGAGEAEEATGEAAVETTDGATTALNATSDAPPAAVALLRPFPNPGARATLRFGLPEAGPVRLAVYDVTGRRVALLVDEAREQGWHTAAFDAPGLASGVYLVRLEAGGHVLTHRFTLLR